MSSDNEVLYLVHRTRHGLFNMPINKSWVFRTREAARQFRKDRKDHDKYSYTVVKATWGPEQ